MNKQEAFKLRMVLLKIWAIKNVTVFLEIFMYILVIMVLTGQIGKDTPIFVWFGLDQLSSSMNDVLIQDFNIGNMLLNIVTLISSAIVVIGTVSSQAKRIALKDIKNPALKRSLVRAGLYFNKDGKLVKRIEEATKIDIDGDNKIGDKDIEEFPHENIFEGIKRTGQEFFTIVSFKPEKIEDINKLVEENNMVETAVALQEAEAILKQSKKEFTLEDAAETIVAAKEFLESAEGQELQAKTTKIVELAGDKISEVSIKSGTFFKKALTSTGNGIVTAVKFIGTGIAKSGKFIFNTGSTIGNWIKSGITSLGSAIGKFFKKLFTKKQKSEQDSALTQILAAKKIEKEQIAKIEQPKQEVQPKIETPVSAPKKVNPKVDPLEALRQKYGR